MPIKLSSIRHWILTAGLLLSAAVSSSAQAQNLADSRTEFSGVQGQDGWRYGYRVYTEDEGDNYDPAAGFIAFDGGNGQGDWDGSSQFWTGAIWDQNTAAAGPWTEIQREAVHPNGANSAPNEEYWVVRRWVADELSGSTVVKLVWNTRKANAAGNGVTGGIWLNGKKTFAATIAGNNTTGVTRTNFVTLKKGDFVDLVLTPVGTDGGRADGSDGSAHWLQVSVAADTDADGLPDEWETSAAGNLTTLTANGDADSDGIKDSAELPLGTNPTKADSDNDGLADGVETNTGAFVSATNTGTDPLNPDTDNDGRKDGDEVNGTPKTDVFKADSDDDTYLDGAEVANGHNPNDPNDTLVSSLIANSILDFSGEQGKNNWRHGYRNVSADGGAQDYDPDKGFIPFPGGEGQGDWANGTQVWTGAMWDLNTAAAAPWTELSAETSHPNGPNPVHWVIRRWEAKALTKVTPLALRYHVRKTNLGGGNGVTASLYINGKRVDTVTIAFNNGVGALRTVFANVAPSDRIDVILSPRGLDNGNADGSDGSAFYLHVDPVLLALPLQPNGDLFTAVGAPDTDNDSIADAWELFHMGNLTALTKTGDSDGDGLIDPDEFKADTNPKAKDTDGDGLNDNVETNTRVYVSASNTGSNPKAADTDADGLSDGAEVTAAIVTNPNLADSDGDLFSDPEEIAEGTNPNNKSDNPKAFVIADSVAEFSGVQGKDGWYNGYRNFTADGGGIDYDPQTQFIAYAGGEGQGDWDGESQMWTGTAWDLNTAAAGPWTYQVAEGTHPNGSNSAPNEEHWAIRRWVASELTAETDATIVWRVRKENTAGGGVGGILFVNGKAVDSVVIAGNDSSNPKRKVDVRLKKGDVVDLALTPENVDGTRSDGSDGSFSWFWVDLRPKAAAPIAVKSWSLNAANRQFSLTWDSAAGAKYAVESSSILSSGWSKLQTGIASGGASTTFTDSAPANGTRYYRVFRE